MRRMFAPNVLSPLVRQAGAAVGANPISRNLSAESYASVAAAAVPSEGIPFEAVIHFTNHSAKPDLMHPWKVDSGKQ